MHYRTSVKSSPRWLAVLALLGAAMVAGLVGSGKNAAAARDGSGSGFAAKFARLPISFEANEGQVGAPVRFLSRGSGFNLFLTPTGSVLTLSKAPPRDKDGKRQIPRNLPTTALRMRLVGGNHAPKVVGTDKLPGRTNYFIGRDPKQWRRNVSTYAKVRYKDVYRGVDMVYYGNQSELEYDFVLKPGTDPTQIRMGYRGAEKLSVSDDGELLFHTPLGAVRQKKPVAYQQMVDGRREVEATYALLGDNQVGFHLAAYDPTRPLVIDPVLRYSTFVGGSTDDYAFDITTDSDKNVYFAGYTGSFDQDSNGEANHPFAPSFSGYPRVNAIQGDPDRGNSHGSLFTDAADETNIYCSRYDAFITKLSPAGFISYSTYIGAEDDDYGLAVAVDASKNMYLTGMTYSIFLPLVNARQTNNAGGTDAFVVKLNPDGNTLFYSTYLGGSLNDRGRAIAADATGNAYIAGITSSRDFPVFSTQGPANIQQQTYGGGNSDAFVVSLDASGSAFNYSTYLGGNGDEWGIRTTSGGSDVDPATSGATGSPINLNYQPGGTPFVNTFFPGAPAVGGLVCNPGSKQLGQDATIGLAVDPLGNVYVAGGTTSTNLRTNLSPGVVQTANAGPAGTLDGFVAKFDVNGRIQRATGGYLTYLGGSGDDACRDVAVDPSGNAYVTGYTTSGDFKVQAPPPTQIAGSLGGYQGTFRGGTVDAFVTKLNPGGAFGATGTTFSTYLGGSGNDIGNGIAVSTSGFAYVTGSTTSTSPVKFPTRNYIQADRNGSQENVFVTKFLKDGSDYEYSTYLGGSQGSQRGMAIAVDPGGQAYITGIVTAYDFPRSAGGRGFSFNPNTFPLPEAFVTNLFSPPNAASNLSITDVQKFQISLAWTDNSDNEDGFDIERKTGPNGSFAVVATVGPNTVNYTDTGLTPSTTYVYRIRPFNFDGTTTFFGPYSNQVQADTLPDVPAAPTGLTVTPIDTVRLKLDFTDNSNNETAFKIERRQVSGSPTAFAQITTLPADNTVTPQARTFTDTGLKPNTTYEYRVRASNSAGDSAYAGPTQGTTLPNKPTTRPTLKAKTVSNKAIQLDWTYGAAANSPGDELGFKIFRSTDNITFTLLRTTTITPLPPSTNAFTFVDDDSGAGLSPNTTYYYKVRAYNQSGDGPDSNTASATTLPPPPNPADRLVAQLVPPNSVHLTWRDTSIAPNRATGFRIERSTDNFADPANTVVVATLSATAAQTYDDTGLALNTVYYYRVIAFTQNAAGPSEAAPSNTDCVLTLPAAPTAVTATTVSQTQIDVSWKDNNPVPGTVTYEIFRSSDGGATFPQTATGTATVTTAAPAKPGETTGTFSDTGLTPNKAYVYEVRAKNTPPAGCRGGGVSALVSSSNASTLPNPADGLTVTPSFGPPALTDLLLGWNTNNLTPHTARIERSTDNFVDPKNTRVVKSLAIPAKVASTGFRDSGLGGNLTYFYRIVNLNSGGAAAPSPTVSALTLPAKPASLSVNRLPLPQGRTQLVLSWTDASTLPTDFQVERSTDNGVTFQLVATVPPPPGTPAQRTYTDSGLNPGTKYTYRVRGVNATGPGQYSNINSESTLQNAPATPTGLTARVVSDSEIDLKWEDNSNNEDNFIIQRKVSQGQYADFATVGRNVTTFRDTGLAERTTYTYRVIAVNNGGRSAPSREAGGTTSATPAAAPSNLTVTPLSESSIRVSWQDNSANEDSFKVERSTDNFADPQNTVLVKTTSPNVTTFTDTGLASNTLYYYRVKATRLGSDSAPTPTRSGLTFPAQPTNLAVTTPALPTGRTQLNLTWKDNSAKPSAFKVFRSTDNFATPGTLVTTTPVGAQSFSNTGLNPDTTYYYQVVATNATGDSPPSGTASGKTLANAPGAPTGLTATAVSQTQITLNWKDNSSNETGFEVERSTNNFATAGTVVGTTNPDVTTFTDSNLTPSTKYYYRVRAMNSGGPSAYSNVASATTKPNPPTSPSNLSVVNPTQTTLTLTWTDNSTTEDLFRIERSKDGTTFTEIKTVGPNVKTYTDTGLTPDTTYFYQVRASNTGGNSGYTNIASGKTLPGAPGAPSDLRVTNPTQTTLTLVWADNSSNESGFEIERSTDNFAGNVKLVTTTGAGVRTFTDSGLTPDTTYEYRVRAVNTGGKSGYSNVATGKTLPTAPSAPTQLTVTNPTQTTLTLNWTDSSNNESGFKVERSTDNFVNNVTLVTTTGANVKTFKDTALKPDTTYYYRVKATNKGGDSGASNIASGKTLPTAPAAPASLTAAAVSQSEIRLAWTDRSSNEAEFLIERSADGTTFTQIDKVGAGVTEYLDSGLKDNTTYYYRVRASNVGGTSPYSNTANAKTLPAPPAGPSSLSVGNPTQTSLTLSWKDNSTTESGFKIERKEGNAATFTQIKQTGKNVTSFTDTGLKTNTTYTYQVRAFNGGGDSPFSNSASGLTLPGTPAGLTATAASQTEIDLKWTDTSANPAQFQVERSTGNGSFVVIASNVAAGTTTFADQTVQPGTKYAYRVRAFNTSGFSPYSAPASATTAKDLPGSPSNLTVTPISQTELELDWQDNSINETGFKIERSPDGVKFSQIGTSGADQPTFTDKNLLPGRQYFYRVRAFNDGGDSGYTNVASGTTFPKPATNPSGLTVTVLSQTELQLNWKDNSNDESGFRVERSTDNFASPQNTVLVATTDPNVTSFKDGGLNPDTVYFYRVRAFNLGGESANSNTASGRTKPNAPAAPGRLSAVATSSTQVTLTWDDNSDNEDGFKIERQAQGEADFTEIGQRGKDVKTFVDSTVSPGMTYTYQVRAFNKGGDSAYSNTATVQVPVEIASLKLDVGSIRGGRSTHGTVRLTGQVPNGATVTLKSSSSLVIVPASVDVPANSDTATFTVRTRKTKGTRSVTITAQIGASSKSVVLKVTR